jgi:hypothetical protein
MRLTPAQAATIRSAAAKMFRADARAWLFGLRVDDSKRGGDIAPTTLRRARTSSLTSSRPARCVAPGSRQALVTVAFFEP